MLTEDHLLPRIGVESVGIRADHNKDDIIELIEATGKANIERTIFPNELEEFNSVNHMFGLYCLTTDEILDPDNTYMGPKGEPEVVVIKSGGGTRAMGERKAQTSLEKAGGRVE